MDIVKSNTMKSGLRAHIATFRNVHSIDVEFENGLVAERRDYYRFLAGEIKCPMEYRKISDFVECTNPNTNDTFLISVESLPIVKKYYLWHIDKSNGYVRTGSGVKLHRLLTGCPQGFMVDHINRIRTDNRLCNLRICTAKQNTYNSKTPINSKTGFKCITIMPSGKYRAKIKKDGKQIHIGYYNNLFDALIAYNNCALSLFGEFALLHNTETLIVPEKPEWVK